MKNARKVEPPGILLSPPIVHTCVACVIFVNLLAFSWPKLFHLFTTVADDSYLRSLYDDAAIELLELSVRFEFNEAALAYSNYLISVHGLD